MKVSEVKRNLLEKLEPFAKNNGYKIKKQLFAMEKQEKEATHRLYFTYNHWYDEVQLFPAVEVSIHKITEIIAKFDGVAQNFHSRTFWQNLNKLAYRYEQKSLENFDYEEKDRYKIFTDADIDKIAEDCLCKFENYGLRYVNDFGSLEKLKSFFAPKYLHIDDYLLLNKLILGLIASKLVGNDYTINASLYNDFVEQNKNEISESYVNLFFQVKKYLG